MENFCKNTVKICGEIVEEFTFSHEVLGDRFYTSKISSERQSGTEDIIPILVPERLLDAKQEWRSRFVQAEGSFRSRCEQSEDGNRLRLFVFVKEFEEIENRFNENYIEIQGTICRETVFRKTPLGREICDIMIAVNRPFGKSDYIPCVLWERNARFGKRLIVSDKVRIDGRIQSRKYIKRFSDEEFVERTAYEVSASKIDLIEGEML